MRVLTPCSLVVFLGLLGLGCVVTDSGATTGSGSAGGSGSEEGDGTSGSATSDGPGPTSSDPATATGGSSDGPVADSSGGSDTGPTGEETGPACPPAEVSMVRGCDSVVGEGFCSEGAEHVRDGSEIAWDSDPPHSGPHYPMWEIWGEHDSTVPRGNWVHNLEHGGIVLAYRCPEGCDAELEVLRSVLTERPELRILLTPDPLLPGPRFAAISWTWIHEFDAPDLATLLCFADQHENHAPEDVP